MTWRWYPWYENEGVYVTTSDGDLLVAAGA
eukprot:COSAG01_NODE_20293_length_961_cov_1.098608_1_plen_29_part_10